jgi:SAM-dependent methyltransferase
VGVDASADVIEIARTRGPVLAACDIQFLQAAAEDVALDEPVDAVIGRAILVHLPEPEAVLRHLCGQIRPGGIIAFAEPDITLAGTVPALPLWHAVKSVICDTFLGMGLDPAFGRCLYALFRRAGLPSPQLTLSRPMVGADETELLALMTGRMAIGLPDGPTTWHGH